MGVSGMRRSGVECGRLKGRSRWKRRAMGGGKEERFIGKTAVVRNEMVEWGV